MDYFSLLNISTSFDIDLVVLEAEYFKAQRLFHPDRFVGKPEQEKLAALQKSMDINQAYETLKNPLKRAQHILELQGIIVGTDADTIKPSNSLLMEIMELNEQLADIALNEKLFFLPPLPETGWTYTSRVGVRVEPPPPSLALPLSGRGEFSLSPDYSKHNQLSDLHKNSLLDISKYYANKDWQKMAQEVLRLGYLVKILDDNNRNKNHD